MSKSLGNFFTIREVLKKYDPEVVRFFILRAHYRSPLNYSDVHLDDARQALTRLYTALKPMAGADIEGNAGKRVDWSGSAHARRFKEALDDDFNTPLAMAVLFELAAEVNRSGDAKVAALLKSLGAVLGLLDRDPQAYLQGQSRHYTINLEPGHYQLHGQAAVIVVGNTQIDIKIAERIAAKQAKDFKRADAIRAELLTEGIVLEDKPGGKTEWRRA